MTKERILEILGKQLELLAEKSETATDLKDILDISYAMCRVAYDIKVAASEY